MTIRWTRVADLVEIKWKADCGDLVSLVVLSAGLCAADGSAVKTPLGNHRHLDMKLDIGSNMQ